MIENSNSSLIRIYFGEKCDAFALIQVITLNFDIPFFLRQRLRHLYKEYVKESRKLVGFQPPWGYCCSLPKVHCYSLELSRAFNTVAFVK